MRQNEEILLADPAQHPELIALRAESKLLDARLKQSGLALKAYVSTFDATEQPANAPAMTPGANLPGSTPSSPKMDGLFLGLSHQWDGSKELARIDGEIVATCSQLALAKKDSAQHEALLVELDALLSARAGMWQAQIEIAAIIAPMLSKHGFPLQRANEPAAEPAPTQAP